MNPAISEAGKSLRLARNRAIAATIVVVAWVTGEARAAEEEPKGLSVSKMKDVSMGSAVMQVQFSRDGELLAAACRTGLRLWRLGQDKLPQQLIRAVAGTEGFGCLAFSPDGRNIAIGETVSPGSDTPGTYTGRVRLLQVGSGKQLWERQTRTPSAPLPSPRMAGRWRSHTTVWRRASCGTPAAVKFWEVSMPDMASHSPSRTTASCSRRAPIPQNPISAQA